MQLCDKCSKLSLERLCPQLTPHEDPAASSPDVFYQHAESWDNLKKRAVFCGMCRLVKRSLEIGDEWGHLDEAELGPTNDSTTMVWLRATDVYILDQIAPMGLSLVSPDCGGRFTGILSLYTDPGTWTLKPRSVGSILCRAIGSFVVRRFAWCHGNPKCILHVK